MVCLLLGDASAVARPNEGSFGLGTSQHHTPRTSVPLAFKPTANDSAKLTSRTQMFHPHSGNSRAPIRMILKCGVDASRYACEKKKTATTTLRNSENKPSPFTASSTRLFMCKPNIGFFRIRSGAGESLSCMSSMPRQNTELVNVLNEEANKTKNTGQNNALHNLTEFQSKLQRPARRSLVCGGEAAAGARELGKVSTAWLGRKENIGGKQLDRTYHRAMNLYPDGRAT